MLQEETGAGNSRVAWSGMGLAALSVALGELLEKWEILLSC